MNTKASFISRFFHKRSIVFQSYSYKANWSLYCNGYMTGRGFWPVKSCQLKLINLTESSQTDTTVLCLPVRWTMVINRLCKTRLSIYTFVLLEGRNVNEEDIDVLTRINHSLLDPGAASRKSRLMYLWNHLIIRPHLSASPILSSPIQH